MKANREIDSNYDNNHNCDVSINIPESRLPTERDFNYDLMTPVAEPQMAQVFVTDDAASRKPKRKENKEDNEDDFEENELTDEVDSNNKKICFVRMEDDVSNVEEMEMEETETKKVNSYAAKKTVAQGMMDIALITANANQLRYIVEFNKDSPTFFVIVTLIAFSLLLQVAVGMALIFKGRLDIKGKSKDPDAKRINNYVVVAIFLVTIVNVFIASFTITSDAGKSH